MTRFPVTLGPDDATMLERLVDEHRWWTRAQLADVVDGDAVALSNLLAIAAVERDSLGRGFKATSSGIALIEQARGRARPEALEPERWAAIWREHVGARRTPILRHRGGGGVALLLPMDADLGGQLLVALGELGFEPEAQDDDPLGPGHARPDQPQGRHLMLEVIGPQGQITTTDGPHEAKDLLERYGAPLLVITADDGLVVSILTSADLPCPDCLRRADGPSLSCQICGGTGKRPVSGVEAEVVDRWRAQIAGGHYRPAERDPQRLARSEDLRT